MPLDLVLPDLHLGHHDRGALRCVLRAYDLLKPERVVILGDWLDAHSWNAHPATPGEKAAHYLRDEIEPCKLILDRFDCEIIFHEGNHEERVRRHMLQHGGPWKDLGELVLPERLLARDNLEWIPYKKFKVLTEGLVSCHGVSVAKTAAAKHLDAFPGWSIVFGHTHRAQSLVRRDPISDRLLRAWCPGTLSELQPIWCKGPTTWSHGFSLIHRSGTDWTAYNVPIDRARCVLPCGTVIDGSEAL